MSTSASIKMLTISSNPYITPHIKGREHQCIVSYEPRKTIILNLVCCNVKRCSVLVIDCVGIRSIFQEFCNTVNVAHSNWYVQLSFLFSETHGRMTRLWSRWSWAFHWGWSSESRCGCNWRKSRQTRHTGGVWLVFSQIYTRNNSWLSQERINQRYCNHKRKKEYCSIENIENCRVE